MGTLTGCGNKDRPMQDACFQHRFTRALGSLGVHGPGYNNFRSPLLKDAGHRLNAGTASFWQQATVIGIVVVSDKRTDTKHGR